MNEIATRERGGSLYDTASLKKLGQAIAGGLNALPVEYDGKPILKMTKQGEWKFGANADPLEPEDVIAINPGSFRHGYIAFGDDGPAETVDGDIAERLVPITTPLPYTEDLPELEIIKGKRGDPDINPRWQLQLAFECAVISGPYKGTGLVYKPTSKGGMKLFRILAEEVARRLIDGNDDCVPVVELFSSHYAHKKYGNIFTPEAKIIDWMNIDDDTFEVAPAGEPDTKEADDGPRRGRGRPRKEDETAARNRRRDDDSNEADANEDPKQPPERRARRDADQSEPDTRRARRGENEDQEAADAGRARSRDRDADTGDSNVSDRRAARRRRD